MLRGWVDKESRRRPIWFVEKGVVMGAYPSSLMSWYGGWLGYWACQKFQASEIMLTTEEPMHDF